MQFVCPICAGTSWREVVVPKGGGYYKTAFSECCGCSAMFRSADLFTVGRGKMSTDADRIDEPQTKPRLLITNCIARVARHATAKAFRRIAGRNQSRASTM